MSTGGLRALSELRPGAPLAAVSVGGRVVLTGSTGFRLAQDATTLVVVSDAAPVLGAWVVVLGEWTGAQLSARSVTQVALPQRDLARADSDFAWAQAGGVAQLERRHAAQRALRAFFDRAGFVEVDTPAVVRSPGLELHLEALEVSGAGAARYLHTSPEYHMKRLLSAGMSRIYQLCRAYRRDEHGSLHQPEFTMLEWYRAFADSEQLMADTEQLSAALARELYGGTRIHGTRGEIDLAPPWERLTVREAFKRHANADSDALLADEEAFFRVLVDQVEPELGRQKPVFLTHYPASMAALAKLRPEDPTTADRFEAYVDGMELCNGFGELTDPVEQRRRFEQDVATRTRTGRPTYPIDERFLAALADGLPPCAGNALGFDRLLLLLEGKRNIAEVVAFSADRT